MIDDGSLLRAYVRGSLEAAFSQLVERHINLVYGTALKQLGGNVHRAQEVTQQVFSALARKAEGLLHRKTLAGWLYLATRHAVAELMRSEQRRQHREQQAQLMQEANSVFEPDWLQLKPLLDRALGELKNQDRDVLLLRYFEVQAFAEIAETLGLKEDAARRRCERALQRLRAVLARRGATSTASALALALGNEAVATAPVGLAAMVTGIALTEAASIAAASVGVTLLHFMSTMKVTTGMTAVMIAILLGSAFHHHKVGEDSHRALAAARSRYETERKRYEDGHRRVQSAEASAPVPAQPHAVSQADATPNVVPPPPELVAAYRSQQYAFWNREYESFIADRHMTPEQVAQFDAAIDPDPKIKVFQDPKGRVVFSLASDTATHSDENLRALLGPEGFQAMKAFQKYNEADGLAGATSAASLMSGTPIAPDRVQRLAEIIAQNDRGPVNRMAGPPNLYDWETIFEQARGLLSEDQLTALNAIKLQTSYQIDLANVLYPETHISKEAP